MDKIELWTWKDCRRTVVGKQLNFPKIFLAVDRSRWRKLNLTQSLGVLRLIPVEPKLYYLLCPKTILAVEYPMTTQPWGLLDLRVRICPNTELALELSKTTQSWGNRANLYLRPLDLGHRPVRPRPKRPRPTRPLDSHQCYAYRTWKLFYTAHL